MLFHVDMIYLAKQAKLDVEKALLRDENSNQIEPRTGFLQFYVKTKKVCRCFASFSSEQEHFTHGLCLTAPMHPSVVKKSNRSCSVKEKMSKFSGAASPWPSR